MKTVLFRRTEDRSLALPLVLAPAQQPPSMTENMTLTSRQTCSDSATQEFLFHEWAGSSNIKNSSVLEFPGQLKATQLRNGAVKFLWSSSTPEFVLKEGLSRTISTIPGADFSREGEKWSSSAAQHGIFRNFKISQPSLVIMAPGARLTRAPAAPG